LRVQEYIAFIAAWGVHLINITSYRKVNLPLKGKKYIPLKGVFNI